MCDGAECAFRKRSQTVHNECQRTHRVIAWTWKRAKARSLVEVGAEFKLAHDKPMNDGRSNRGPQGLWLARPTTRRAQSRQASRILVLDWLLHRRWRAIVLEEAG